MEALTYKTNSYDQCPAEDAITSEMVMGLPVACVQIPDVIQLMIDAIERKAQPRYFVLLGMHGLMEGRQDPKTFSALREAGLLLPDGMPLVWLTRVRGHTNMKRRVYGPELMMKFCEVTRSKYKHFFYGAAPGIAELLAAKLQGKFSIHVTRTITPPYYDLSDDDVKHLAQEINNSNSDIVWIGISTPKQDLLMQRLRPFVTVPLMLGVGAAFDFNSDNKKMAPHWMQELGLEWLYRLISEPKRLWRRYLLLGPKFVALSLIDLHQYRRKQRKSNGVSKSHP